MRTQGFVASLKENFGFIKNAESDNEYFFHYSEIRDADVRDFERGTEVGESWHGVAMRV